MQQCRILREQEHASVNRTRSGTFCTARVRRLSIMRGKMRVEGGYHKRCISLYAMKPGHGGRASALRLPRAMRRATAKVVATLALVAMQIFAVAAPITSVAAQIAMSRRPPASFGAGRDDLSAPVRGCPAARSLSELSAVLATIAVVRSDVAACRRRCRDDRCEDRDGRSGCRACRRALLHSPAAVRRPARPRSSKRRPTASPPRRARSVYCESLEILQRSVGARLYRRAIHGGRRGKRGRC